MGQRLGQVKVRYGMFPQGLYNINHMPIPESISIPMPDDYEDEKFLSRAYVDPKWCWWPQRCHASGRWMWLTSAYRAQYVITGPGDPAIWYRWYSNTEYLMLQLKHG
jgi:hypothetical protein